MDFKVHILFHIMFIIVVQLSFDEENLTQAHLNIKDAAAALSVVDVDLQGNFLVREVDWL